MLAKNQRRSDSRCSDRQLQSSDANAECIDACGAHATSMKNNNALPGRWTAAQAGWAACRRCHWRPDRTCSSCHGHSRRAPAHPHSLAPPRTCTIVHIYVGLRYLRVWVSLSPPLDSTTFPCYPTVPSPYRTACKAGRGPQGDWVCCEGICVCQGMGVSSRGGAEGIQPSQIVAHSHEVL